MGQNSIHCNLSKEDIIAEIRLTLAADFDHKKGIVVVEGADDILFFNGKLHQDIDIRESFSGKRGVEEIVSHFSDDRVIGICDADYDLRNACPQMLFYDYSCLEMMLISNDSVFSPFFYAYYQGPKSPQEVRLQVLSNLKWLSLYRKLSTEHNWDVKFSGISIAKAFNRTSQKIDIANLLGQIRSINSGQTSPNRRQLELLSEACKEEYTLDRYLFITQGHDFLYCFQSLCESTKRLNRKSPGAGELFHSLLCSCHYENFLESELYQSLVLYQATYNISLLPS